MSLIQHTLDDGTKAPALVVGENEDGTVNLRVFGRTAEEADTFVNHVERKRQSSSSSTDDAKPPAKKAAPRKSAAKKAPAKKAAAS
jgi:hypothetical protein